MKVHLETFGCQMNELDSELVQGQLVSLGYQFVDNPADAQVIIFNTCSVREQAEQKACSRIGLVGMRKRQGEGVILGVIGCMAERDGMALFKRYPQIDLLCGPGELDRLPTLIDNARKAQLASHLVESVVPAAERAALAGNKNRRSATLAAAQDNLEALDLSRSFDPAGGAQRRFSAYVRITRGCNKFCTYCVVPNTRGAEIHRPPDHIVDECRRLVDAGAIEITLLGQTVNHYRYEHGLALTALGKEAPQVGPGLSSFGEAATSQARAGSKRITTFADLLRRIHDEVPELPRLRFVTSYPRDFGNDILQAMRDCPRICRYLHAPLQSGSDRILKLMNRGYTVAQYMDFVARTSEILPDACLAGDIIVGFPTESDDDFAATCSIVERLPFKNNFIFKYSPRPGTPAFGKLADDVPDHVKRARNNHLLALQSGVSLREHRKWIGRQVPVLFDSVRSVKAPVAGAGHTALGRPNTRRPRPELVPLQVTANPAFSANQRGTEALVSESNPMTQVIGRTPGDLIVAVDCNSFQTADEYVGKIASVALLSAEPLIIRGSIELGFQPSLSAK